MTIHCHTALDVVCSEKNGKEEKQKVLKQILKNLLFNINNGKIINYVMAITVILLCVILGCSISKNYWIVYVDIVVFLVY